MTAKRIFQIYEGEEFEKVGKHLTGKVVQRWRWRLIATRNGQIVGGSQEAFDSRGNALRAARREASFYQPGVAAVEVAP
jgi:hypothetical protein